MPTLSVSDHGEVRVGVARDLLSRSRLPFRSDLGRQRGQGGSLRGGLQSTSDESLSSGQVLQDGAERRDLGRGDGSRSLLGGRAYCRGVLRGLELGLRGGEGGERGGGEEEGGEVRLGDEGRLGVCSSDLRGLERGSSERMTPAHVSLVVLGCQRGHSGHPSD
jgi:hypothetical protein